MSIRQFRIETLTSNELTAHIITLSPPPHSQPVPSVVDRMCRIESRLKYHSGLHLAWNIIFIVIIHFWMFLGRSFIAGFGPPFRVILISERIVRRSARRRVGSTGKWRGQACRGFELTRTLPFGSSGEPKHKPVVRIVIFGEMGRQKERCLTS